MGAAAPSWDDTDRHDPGHVAGPLPPRMRTSVLVCGAGPVGLVLALLLARHGVDSLVVERHPGPSLHPKARGLTPRTMEVLDRAGVAAEADAAGRANDGGVHTVASLTTLTGTLLTRFPVGTPASDASPWPSTLLGQDTLERLLLERCLREPRVALRFGTELVAFTDDGDEVEARLHRREDGSVSRVHASWLAGCDGPRSTVRQGLGLALDGEFDLDHNVNVLFDADLDPFVRERRSVVYTLRDVGVPCSILAVDNRRRWLFSFRVPDGAAVSEWCTEDVVTGLLARAIGRPDVPFALRSTVTWSPSAAVASSYRKGRAVLAGDAAHVMPPTGAMGANTGIQDADNLAWKIAMVVRGDAGEGLVDSYETERRPVAVRTVAEALSIFRDGVGRPRRIPLDVLLDYRYEAGALFDPAGAGDRAPHAELVLGGRAQSVLRSFGSGLVLVTGPRPGPWPVAARDAGVELLTVGEAQDPAGTFAARYRIPDGGAVLVRPDGVIAWRAAASGAGRLAEALGAITSLSAATRPQASARHNGSAS